MTVLKKSLGLAAILAASVSGAAIAQSTAGALGSVADSNTAANAGSDIKTEGNIASTENSQVRSGAKVTADTNVAASNTAENAGSDIKTSGKAGVSVTAGADPSVADQNTAASLGSDIKLSGEGANWTYGQVVSSLRAGNSTNVDIAGINDGARVETVTLSQLAGQAAENSSSLDNAMEANMSNMTTMRGMISDNAEFKAMLAAEGYQPEDVIGIYGSADGSVQVLVDDRS